MHAGGRGRDPGCPGPPAQIPHQSVTSTLVYARADEERLRRAMARCPAPSQCLTRGVNPSPLGDAFRRLAESGSNFGPCPASRSSVRLRLGAEGLSGRSPRSTRDSTPKRVSSRRGIRSRLRASEPGTSRAMNTWYGPYSSSLTVPCSCRQAGQPPSVPSSVPVATLLSRPALDRERRSSPTESPLRIYRAHRLCCVLVVR